MKKALTTLTISVALVLIITLSAWAGFVDLLIDPATLHTCTGGEVLNFNGKILNDPDMIDSHHFDFYQNDGGSKFMSTHPHVKLCPGDLADIMWSGDGMPTMTTIAAYRVDAGEASIYSPSFTEFGMMKKVLEPSTMLLLGGCLLGIGLFAIKFRK